MSALPLAVLMAVTSGGSFLLIMATNQWPWPATLAVCCAFMLAVQRGYKWRWGYSRPEVSLTTWVQMMLGALLGLVIAASAILFAPF